MFSIIKLAAGGTSDTFNSRYIRNWESHTLNELIRVVTSRDTSGVQKLLPLVGSLLNSSKHGNTPLFHACMVNNNKDVVELLVANGAGVNILNSNGSTPLMWVLQNWNGTIPECLIPTEKKFIDAQDQNGCSALARAAQSGYEKIVAGLIHKGADVNLQTNLGWTPLNLAIYRGYRNIAILLVQYNADVNLKTIDGWSPLMVAGWKFKDLEIPRLLVRHGANISDRISYGYNASTIAAKIFHDDVAQYLVDVERGIPTIYYEEEYNKSVEVIAKIKQELVEVNRANNASIIALRETCDLSNENLQKSHDDGFSLRSIMTAVVGGAVAIGGALGYMLGRIQYFYNRANMPEIGTQFPEQRVTTEERADQFPEQRVTTRETATQAPEPIRGEVPAYGGGLAIPREPGGPHGDRAINRAHGSGLGLNPRGSLGPGGLSFVRPDSRRVVDELMAELVTQTLDATVGLGGLTVDVLAQLEMGAGAAPASHVEAQNQQPAVVVNGSTSAPVVLSHSAVVPPHAPLNPAVVAPIAHDVDAASIPASSIVHVEMQDGAPFVVGQVAAAQPAPPPPVDAQTEESFHQQSTQSTDGSLHTLGGALADGLQALNPN